MNRIEVLRKYIDNIILDMKDIEERRCAYVHLYGVAQYCSLLSVKRKLNCELAIMAGMLHDLYSYKTMIRDNHAHKGADLAKDTLIELDIANKQEIAMICSAIYNHSDKDIINSEFDEILKDADVLQHCMYNPLFEVKEHEKTRFERIKKEFGLI